MNLFRRKTRHEERRVHYRRQIPADAFEAILRNGAGEGFLVAVADISLGGATVRTGSACQYIFEAEEKVILDLVIGQPAKMIHIQSEVRRVDEQGLHLSFYAPTLDELDLDAESRMLLSRRRHPRLKLREYIGVELTIGCVVVTADLIDVSESGIGVHLSEDLAGRLGVDQVVDVAFTLPGCLAATVVKAKVRHRTPHAGTLLFGFEFQPERSDELNAVVEFLGRSNL